MAMNKRSVDIIHQMLASTNQRLLLNELARKYDVSERTIRNDINRINQFFHDKNGELLKLEIGGSIRLNNEINKKELKKDLKNIDFYDYALSKEERVCLNICLLALIKGYITYQEIAEIMYTSRHTVINDFIATKEVLKKYNIEVQSLSNKGLRLKSKEKDIRKIIISIIINNTKLIGHLLRQEKVAELIGLEKEKIDEKLEIISRIINEAENESGLYLTDISIERLTYYLYFITVRIENNNRLFEKSYEGLEKERFSICILERMAQYFELYIDAEEVSGLQSYLMKLNYIRKEINNPDILKIQTLTRKFIEGISDLLDINLNNDYTFFKNLSNHLERLFRNDTVKYPEYFGIDEIVERNKEVLKVVEEKKYILEEYSKREIELQDMKFISVYICVAIEKKKNKVKDLTIVTICNNGISTSQFLKEQLIKYFDFISIEVLPYHEFKEKNLDKVDLIISTVELPETDKEYVLVSPILSIEDILRIDNKLDEIKLERIKGIERNKSNFTISNENHFKDSIALSDLLKVKNIELDIGAKNWREAIEKASRILEDNGDIEKKYTEAMIENIEENGPYIVISKGFALPHGKFDHGVNRLSMSLVRLKEPVKFGIEELDPIYFICVLSAIDDKAHLKALFTLLNILKMEGFYSSIKAAKEKENLHNVIKKYEEKYIKLNNWR